MRGLSAQGGLIQAWLTEGLGGAQCQLRQNVAKERNAPAAQNWRGEMIFPKGQGSMPGPWFYPGTCRCGRGLEFAEGHSVGKPVECLDPEARQKSFVRAL